VIVDQRVIACIRRLAFPTVVLVALGCDHTQNPPPPLRLQVERSGDNTRLALVAAPGVLISARLRPALELPNGAVLRFDGAWRSPDSAYFAGPPTAVLAGRRDAVSGTVHASICLESERVCRSVSLKL